MLAFFGVLVLTPDTLVIRLSGLERWALMGWRGVLMGAMSLLIWRYILSRDPSQEWRSLASWPGLLVITTFGMNSATFTLGIVETSATVVLTAVATMVVSSYESAGQTTPMTMYYQLCIGGARRTISPRQTKMV